MSSPYDDTLLDEILPDVVYKFRNIREAYHVQLLAERTIYFSQFNLLNDPFDASLVYRFDRMGQEDCYVFLLEFLRSTEPSLTDEEIRAKISQSDLMLEGPLIFSKNSAERMQKQCSAHIGVFSSSPACNDLLMWSHYADGHAGFCVGLDPRMIIETAEAIQSKDVYVECRKVVYSNDPNLDPLNTTTLDRMVKILTTKFGGWGYENEIRFIMYPKSRRDLTPKERCLVLPDSAVREVVLGWKMAPHHQNEIKAILRGYSSRPRLYEIDTEFGEYRLNLREIHY